MPVTTYRGQFNEERRFYQAQPGETACNGLERALRDPFYPGGAEAASRWRACPYDSDVYRMVA